ncbi:short chain dehydrogenase/reductase family oxidoreductase [Legionella geestiana]|uniref:Short chain dehydrogenase/reductase family oxidoreductase n=1 Tax=Legionella geestiana TaxID=45065 RepID=A0A0W0U8U9_9GAMM|nr:SDR family oxidoreductase [Legionella geestiana]KTD04398.1 short chain dehydrogenase/reductase family oxidoreductase [Legionella geestiana]QBS12948.1 SDR family oxidoreductase [Legionella geestiana]QDQ39369.1 SDR family oxidoreductase [Legionella geestiana]STX54550.1 short chain dehydrogenase/reductase family oxidoreductase [Legionella geestiana]
MNKPLVIVTGASSGIGAAIAKIFSEAGYPLGLFARNKEAMNKLNLSNTICLSVDVTDIHELNDAIQTAEKKFGPVDCLINNAGYAKAGEFTDVGHTDHLNTVNVNLTGVINGIECVLPGMRARTKGTIINISSLADRNPRPGIATYAATKAAVKSLGESLRAANAKYGIRICNLAPAKINTSMLISTGLNDNQIIQAEDLAKAVLWIYQQPQTICVRDLVFAPTFYEA